MQQQQMTVVIHNPDFPMDFLTTWTVQINDHTLRIADIESIVNLAVLLGATIVTNEPGVRKAALARDVPVQEVGT